MKNILSIAQVSDYYPQQWVVVEITNKDNYGSNGERGLPLNQQLSGEVVVLRCILPI